MNRAIGAVTKYCGVAAALLAWAIFAYAMSINPWFVFAEYAFSDLGGSLAADPIVYNAGMMALGTLLILYSLRCLDDSVNKLETVGGAFLAIAGVFLIFIGVYPSGTGPHGFVSYWFFAQTDLAILVWGLGLVERGEKDLGTVVAGLGLLSPMVAYLVPWPSTAMAETFGIVVMNIWVLLMQRVHV
ncbi:hypothetical protein A3K81_02005 [Candidatus Bathyarchaeota archaeon RBG_13_60_20]|jgi:hypothetical membrane protein|nr:MAG: hypothetical protein A3K81_02005 [Candidatus Bathyarchaeota archaeon RBG_13_60_20]